MPSTTEGMFLFIVFAFWAFVYFVPTFIAHTRHHRNFASILIINLCLGWTVLGWVGALAWAFSKDVKTQPVNEGL